jgi:hypothetical protein
MELQSSNFEGWAVVELFGHQREVGFVTTQVFGAAVLFRIDTPELPEREYTLERPEQVKQGNSHLWGTIGSKVKRESVPAKTKLVGPSAIYAMTPCTEQTARMAIERMIQPPVILLELAPQKALPSAAEEIADEGMLERCCEECGQTPEDGHRESCSFAELNDEEG